MTYFLGSVNSMQDFNQNLVYKGYRKNIPKFFIPNQNTFSQSFDEYYEEEGEDE